MTAEPLRPDPAGLARAAELLRDGALVAFPTETVYGLGARADDGRAVAAIYAAKGRPAFNPLILHLASLEMAEELALLSPTARDLAEAFWPGALTLVLPLRDGAPVASLATAGLPSVALRMPDHPVARRLLEETGLPVAAPSANPSGRISPTTAAHVTEGLGDRIAAVVDGGPCPVGVESTILSLLGTEPRLLRAGGLPAETLETALGRPLTAVTTPDETAPLAPGQLASHYAPRGTLRLNVTQPGPDETWLGFGPCPGAALSLSESGDLAEAAARLFDCLHRLDAMGALRIAVAPVPDHGLGRAINDRLSRAAAPR